MSYCLFIFPVCTICMLSVLLPQGCATLGDVSPGCAEPVWVLPCAACRAWLHPQLLVFPEPCLLLQCPQCKRESSRWLLCLGNASSLLPFWSGRWRGYITRLPVQMVTAPSHMDRSPWSAKKYPTEALGLGCASCSHHSALHTRVFAASRSSQPERRIDNSNHRADLLMRNIKTTQCETGRSYPAKRNNLWLELGWRVL